MHLVSLRGNQSGACKVTSGFQVLSYMVKQGKLSLTKIGKENLQVCRLEAGGPVNGEILIRQTIGLQSKSFKVIWALFVIRNLMWSSFRTL